MGIFGPGKLQSLASAALMSGDTKWRHGTWWSLDWILACCLMVPSNCKNCQLRNTYQWDFISKYKHCHGKCFLKISAENVGHFVQRPLLMTLLLRRFCARTNGEWHYHYGTHVCRLWCFGISCIFVQFSIIYITDECMAPCECNRDWFTLQWRHNGRDGVSDH